MNDKPPAVSKLQPPSTASSRLRAPTVIAKQVEPLPKPAEAVTTQQQEHHVSSGSNAAQISSKAVVVSPMKSANPLKYQETPQRFSLQPQSNSTLKVSSTQSGVKQPSLLIKTHVSEAKSSAAAQIVQGKIPQIQSKIPVISNKPSQESDNQKQQKVQQDQRFKSMIGKGLQKPHIQSINLEEGDDKPEESNPFGLCQEDSPKASITLMAEQQKNKMTATIGRFGFKQQRSDLLERANDNLLSKETPIQEEHKVPTKASLEETLKSLEQCVANLPDKFKREPRLQRFIPLAKQVPTVIINQHQIETIPHTITLNQKDKYSAKRDQLKLAKQNGMPVVFEKSFSDNIIPEVTKTYIVAPAEEEKEERNLPLTAFLQQPLPTQLVRSQAPLGDDDSQGLNDDEDLMNDDFLFDRVPLLDNDLLLDDLQLEEIKEEDKYQRQNPTVQIQVHIVKGDFDEVEELKQSSDSNILSLSTQPETKSKNVIQKKLDDALSQASSNIKPQSQPGDQLSSLSSSSANPLQLLRQISGQSGVAHPRIGLSACQRQGPALAAKKAFDHKRKRFAKELNADALNQHLQQPVNDGRIQCEHCGRRFNQDIVTKHTDICEKVFIRKRKAFPSLRQRAVNEDHFKQVESAQQKFSYYQDNQQLNTKWKLRSHQFRQAMALARGGNVQEQVETQDQDDRVLCKYCQKKFAPSTADRHIPLCEKKSKDLKHKDMGNTKVQAGFSKTTTSGFNRTSNPSKR